MSNLDSAADLPIVALARAAGGGFYAARVPQMQSSEFRLASVPHEYVMVAAEAIVELTNNWAALTPPGSPPPPPLGYLRLCFVEPVGGPPPDALQIARFGFYSHARPQWLYIVVPSAPIEKLRAMVWHEVAHAAYYLAYGPDGYQHYELGPSEAFADAVAGDDLHGIARQFLAPLGAGLSRQAFIGPGVDAGIAVTNGKITVINPGSIVILDGTSDMFKIAATGTMNLTGPDGSGSAGGNAIIATNIATGLTIIPAHLGYLEFPAGIASSLPHYDYDISNGYAGSGLVLDGMRQDTQVWSTNQTRVTARWSSRLDRSAITYTFRYYVLKEAAL